MAPIGTKRPTIRKSGLDWFDSKIGLRDNSGQPFGSWIIISGPPGSGKTTVGLTILDAFGLQDDIKVKHFDGENGSEQTRLIYSNLGMLSLGPDDYECDPNGLNLLDRIESLAKQLELNGQSLVVLIDSFKLLGYTNREMQESALKIKSLRETCKNLLIITVNHLTKNGVIEGPANIVQLCDVWLTVSRRGDFRYLSTSVKNRYEMPDAPETIKLSKGITGKPFLSKEPDFISDNTIVKVLRGLPFLKRNNAKGTTENKT